MSYAQKSLKAQNNWKIGVFIIVQIVFFWSFYLSNGFDIVAIVDTLQQIDFKRGFVAVLIPFLSIVINGVFSPDIKATIISWKLKNALPGFRAFTKIARKDSRINFKSLEAKLGNLPTDPNAQNTLWFKIYKRHENKPSIIESHKVYLLTRDLTAISFLLLIFAGFSLLFVNIQGNEGLIFLGVLVIQYLVLNIVARNYGNRFVANALAEEIVS